ncbi:HpcH/HpaI aldolase/citrate lyase family protein [Orrella marina]|uniref:CoA ester lyase n=1 Tax=Orrella marina TaxID=2163011 RepID=A0A2R4XLB3_9BURK|nr:CoA ester lyase [Orrella marina]AWB34551.1 CoA ester lyase [Orrella marina]
MTKTSPSQTWRSLLFVPAHSDKFLESALRRDADAIQLDLEDACPPDQKEATRGRIGEIAQRAADAGFDVIVRVNRPWRMLVRDLEGCVHPAVKAITLPKVPDGSFIRSVSEVLDECEIEAGLPVGHTRLIAMVEDADGLANLDNIAQAHSRVYGMIVGAEDLAVSMRMAVDPDGLYIPNVMTVVACRRAGIVPLGFVGSVADFADREKFRETVQRAARLGFEGAFCVHPSQVEAANEAFSPDPRAVERARALLETFDAEMAAGRAACKFEGRMVDAPVAAQARLLIERDEAISAMKARRTAAKGT